MKEETRGRKPLPDEIRRSGVIRFRVTDQERQLLKDAAEEKGEDLSNWMRSILLRAARRIFGD